jgi:hypothetical protein
VVPCLSKRSDADAEVLLPGDGVVLPPPVVDGDVERRAIVAREDVLSWSSLPRVVLEPFMMLVLDMVGNRVGCSEVGSKSRLRDMFTGIPVPTKGFGGQL